MNAMRYCDCNLNTVFPEINPLSRERMNYRKSIELICALLPEVAAVVQVGVTSERQAVRTFSLLLRNRRRHPLRYDNAVKITAGLALLSTIGPRGNVNAGYFQR